MNLVGSRFDWNNGRSFIIGISVITHESAFLTAPVENTLGGMGIKVEGVLLKLIRCGVYPERSY